MLKTAPINRSMPRHLRPLLLRFALRALALPWCLALPVSAAEKAAALPADAIALAVVFDTSGSMAQPIPTKPGSPPSAKILVARRAFDAVIERLNTFAAAPNAKPLYVGLYVFQGNHGRTALPLARFDAAKLRAAIAGLEPGGATPLGATMLRAGRDLLAARAASRHMLVLTDGENTAGPKPEKALAQLLESGTRQQVSLFTHVIALDIKPAVFATLQKNGATLIGAADEVQLNAQFDFILEEKILIEAPRAAR
jgi:hypothetical protein